MFENEDSFRQLVAQSPELQARWHTITDDLIATAKGRWGVDIAKEDLATISAVKLFTLTGEKIGDPLEQMAQSMPAIKRASEARELREAISQEDHANHAAAVEDIYALNPAARMRRAREMGATYTPPAEERPQLTPAERAKALKRLETLRGSARISEARRLGLA